MWNYEKNIVASIIIIIFRCNEWLTAINREDLIDKDFKYKTHHVCSSHFKESAFKIIKHLKSDAVPDKSKSVNQKAITDSNVQTEANKSLENEEQVSEVLSANTLRKRKLTNDFKTSKQLRRRFANEIKKNWKVIRLSS